LQNQQSIGRDFNIVSSHVTVNVKSKPLVNILFSSVTLSEPFIRTPDYSFPSQTKSGKMLTCSLFEVFLISIASR